jgi:hypothetical protein
MGLFGNFGLRGAQQLPTLVGYSTTALPLYFLI